jgi:MFS family permease
LKNRMLDGQTFLAAWVSTFCFNMTWGIVYPIRNIYIHDQGFSLVLIGTFSTAAAISLSLSGFVYGRISDRLGKRKLPMIFSLVASVLVYLAFLVAKTYFFFLVIVVLEAWLMGGYSILMETLITSILPDDQRGKFYGRYRISGSIGYAVSSALLGTLTAVFSTRAPFVFGAVAVGLAAVATLFMKETSISPSFGSVIEKISWRGTWKVVVRSGVLWLVVADFIATSGTLMAYPFQNIYYKESLLASAGQIGFFSTVSVLFEIPAMLWLGGLSDRIGRLPIMLIGYLSAVVTWALIFFARDIRLIYLASALNGIGIIRHTAGVAFITDRVPYHERATLLSLTYITYGVSGLFAPLLGGAIAQWFGIRSTFLVAASFSLLAGLFFYGLVGRKLDRKESMV